LANHRLPALREMKLVGNSIEDHKMVQYLSSFRTLKADRRFSASAPSSSSPSPPRKLAKSATTASGPPQSVWTKCHVCEEDVLKPYILKGTACRSSATNHCAACGEIVCVVCSPAGDVIPGDGINTNQTTHDFRIPLPQRGLYEPQRLCFPCYFTSYNL